MPNTIIVHKVLPTGDPLPLHGERESRAIHGFFLPFRPAQTCIFIPFLLIRDCSLDDNRLRAEARPLCSIENEE